MHKCFIRGFVLCVILFVIKMESKLFSIVEDEQLIECVQQYPVVFDLNIKGYKDQQVKSNVWKLIAKGLGKDGKYSLCILSAISS